MPPKSPPSTLPLVARQGARHLPDGTRAVGEFVKLEEKYDDMQVEVYVHPQLARSVRANTSKAPLNWCVSTPASTASSMPWPYKYAQVFVQDFIFGGMENTTITVMTDRVLADVGTREEQRLQEVRLNAHELNHHWNGDLVTCNVTGRTPGSTKAELPIGEVEAVEAPLG
jgi:predicted metalloprotease with PDZ domain